MTPVETLTHVAVTTEDSKYVLTVDRAAVSDDGTIYLLSVVAPKRLIGGLTAVLSGHGSVSCRIAIDEETEFQKPGRYDNRRTFTDLKRCPAGYRRHLHRRLNWDMAHAIFVAKTPGFLTVASVAAIGHALQDPDISTTPLLPKWLPWLVGSLNDCRLLSNLCCFQCQCALLIASPNQIDALVLKGGRSGHLTIPA